MKIRKKLFTCMLTLIMCLLTLPITSFANSEENITIKPTQEVNSTAPLPVPLTPNGNLTLVDDIKVEESRDKQFVTLQSKSGNYFYLVIDRSGDKENVYFLNLVDEADLMALIEVGEKKAEPPKVCICSEKCEAGHVNSNCIVCMSDLNQCVSKPAAPIAPKPEKENPSGKLLLIIVLVAGLGGGGFYFFKAHKNKPKTKGNTDPLDYDYDDEEDDENNVIKEDDETEDEAESEDEIK